MGIGYAREKMGVAIRYLAASPDSLDRRLYKAMALSMTHGVSDAQQGDYLPAELLERMNSLVERMTAKEALGNEGTLQATLTTMSEEELVECANEMLDINWEIRQIK